MIRTAAVWAVVAAMVLGAGSGVAAPREPADQVPTGAAAYTALTPVRPANGEYLVATGDTLILRVFQEPELSSEGDGIAVDGGGNIQVPLIGEVAAAGRSPTVIAGEIAARLRQRYLVNPQVTVSVKTLATRTVSVEGQVVKPGVYEIDRNTTLLSAIAKAESPTRVARLGDVVVFRTIDGNRAAARFNLADIRAARAPDPQIYGGDVVVVGFSRGKGAFRDFLQAAPLFNLFYLLR